MITLWRKKCAQPGSRRFDAAADSVFPEQTKNLETLKTRFGEQALQGCEVMLKDLQDSKQLDASVHARMPVSQKIAFDDMERVCLTHACDPFSLQNVPLHATIVSRLFWPSFQPTPLKLPGQLGRYAL